MLNASEDVIREVLALEEQQKKLIIRGVAQKDFMVFVKYVYENFIEGTHHPVHGSLSICLPAIQNRNLRLICYPHGLSEKIPSSK